MSDAALSQTDRQEALSRAYVQAIAAGAGYSTSQPDFDRDSIDIAISARGTMRPRLDVQLKATINLKSSGDSHSFPLPIKNYHDLRAQTQTPRILVVLDMPKDEQEWMSVSVDELILRRAAYWVSLSNSPDGDNETSITVQMPVANIFDVDGLRELMDKSRRGVVK